MAGPYAGKLLGDFGADVVEVEPPGGDPARTAGPFPAGDPEDAGRADDADPVPACERGALHLHLVSTNERSMVADPATPEGLSLVRARVARADVLVESHPPGGLDRPGLPGLGRGARPGHRGRATGRPRCGRRPPGRLDRCPLEVGGVRAVPAEGVPAGPVLDEAELLTDPQLEARGFFRLNGSAELGRCRFPGHLRRWDGPELAWGPINRMGADNAYVYREVAGLDDAEWAALDAEGHRSLDYIDAEGRPL